MTTKKTVGLAKDSYKFKKHWNKIFAMIIIPKDIPLRYTRNIKIILDNGEEIISHSNKEFQNQMNKLTKDDKEINDLMIEINFEQLVTDVEKILHNILD